jgi:peptide-methionine (S)-S-oxide reductase
MYKSIIRFLLVLVLIPNLVYSNKRDTMETVYLAGGCYWGLEDLIRNIPGVETTLVGFTGGLVKNVSYKEVSNGNTGHAESIKVVFDNERLTFDNLLFEFFSMHNPTTVNQQGNDIGSQYRSAIFYSNQNQKEISNKVIDIVNQSKKWDSPVVTGVVPFTEFYPAEDSHQKYLIKNPGGYSCHFDRKFDFTK